MYIERTHSTNTLLRQLLQGEHTNETEAVRPCLDMPIPVVHAGFQTTGRGQAGNGWESKADENLLFSYALRTPPIAPEAQFVLSELASWVLYRTVCDLLPENLQPRLTVKWANDLYYDDRKLAGILVENSLQGKEIAYSITGIGLNINQTIWEGNAPNPVSLYMILGQRLDPKAVLARFMDYLTRYYAEPLDEQVWHDRYCTVLYRRTGFYPYIERTVSVTPTDIARTTDHAEGIFLAEVADISPTGELRLRTESGEERRYHFKQIRFVL